MVILLIWSSWVLFADNLEFSFFGGCSMRVQIAANSGNLREEYWRTLESPYDCLPHFLADYCKLIYTPLGTDGVRRG
jgi:hypothetical protein